VADGAPGIWKAARELWPSAEEQRCTVHALRNVTGKLPERHHRELKARWWQVFDDASSPADARRGLEAIVADYRAAYPSAMAVIADNLDALVAHLRWPTEHRKRIRSTDENVKRPVAAGGRFSGDGSVAAVARRPSDRLYRGRLVGRGTISGDFGVGGLSSRGDAISRSAVGGR
jgi:putative transposase